jgi:hypothetical protein
MEARVRIRLPEPPRARTSAASEIHRSLGASAPKGRSCATPTNAHDVD